VEESTPTKGRNALAARKKFDVASEDVPTKRPSLRKAKSEAEASAASDAIASSSTVTPRRRAAKAKKITYIDPDGSDEDEAEDAEEAESDATDDEESNPCTVCGKEESTDETNNPIMLCDGCDAAICLKCVDPPMDEIPDEYFCKDCEPNSKKNGMKEEKPASSSAAAKPKTTRGKAPSAAALKKTTSAPATATEDADGDIEMIDAPSTASTKKFAPRKPRGKKGVSAVAVDDSDAVDLTHSAPSTPPASPKPKGKKPRLTKAKSAMTAASAAAAAGLTASDAMTDLLPELEEFDDSDAGAPSSAAPRSSSKAATKPPKKMPFEHAFPLIWSEFYDPEEKRWVHVDVMRHLFDSEIVYEYDGGIAFQCIIAARPSIDGAPHLLVDVTKRYTRKWATVAAGRVDDAWMIHHLQRVSGGCAPIDRDIENADHAELEQRHTTSDEMPTRVNEFKTHPLFCIEKFLLKFEMIYPSGPEHSKGVFIEKKKKTKNEDGEESKSADIVHFVYPRSSLHTLHTSDRWRREQRAVKDEEIPYPVKVVKKLSQNVSRST
jgi:hypothetical protein